MKVLTPEQIAFQYIESCEIIRECTLAGDYKRSNKEAEKLVKIFKTLERNVNVAKAVLPTLFANKNLVLRSKAAAHCLSLGVCIAQAKLILDDVAKTDDAGIFGFNAQMTLKVYHEQGFLKVYPEQTVL